MKVRTRLYLPAALAAFALLSAACAAGKAGGAGALHIWTAGSSVTFEMTIGQTQTAENPGGGTQSGSVFATIVFDVEAVGIREFNVSVTDASLSSDPYDLSIPDIKGLVGLESKLHLDERGLVLDATGLAENSFIQVMGGVDDFRVTLQGLFLYLPEVQLKPGVEWTREYSYPTYQQGLEIQFDVVDAYRCVEATTYEGTLSFKIEVSSKVGFSGSGETQGQVIDLALSGTAEGTMYVDAATGLLLMAETAGSLSGGAAVSGMDIPMTFGITTTIKAKK